MGNNPDGGAAFPVDYLELEKTNKGFRYRRQGGLTLRDYFAAQVIGDLIKEHILEGIAKEKVSYTKGLAKLAYVIADDMIAERSK